MVSLFKRKGSRKWVLAWRDASGRRRERVGFRDKRASEQLAARIERELELGQAGLLDPFEAHRKAAIAAHVAEFVVALESRGRTARYVKLIKGRLLRALEAMGAAVLDDLTQSKADAYLRDLRRENSARTRDHYAAALRAFGAWLVAGRRWPLNPFADCQRTATQADATFERRPLTFEELVRVCAAAPVRTVQEYARTHPRARPATLAKFQRTGERRALLYWFAAYTGLRANECRQVRWADLELDAETPSVMVRATAAKNRKAQRVPLHDGLVALLRAERVQQAQDAGRPVRGSEPALHVPRWVVERLRADARFADVDIVDDQGRQLDFHALRATCATLLVRAGVEMSRAAEILRHSDPRITARVYAKLGLADVATGVAKLPDVPVPGHASECQNEANQGKPRQAAPRAQRSQDHDSDTVRRRKAT